MQVVAGFDTLGMRLLGICLASFSSGLGELTFLQLSTTYPISLAGHAVGYFASGTGGAGVGGAGFWWEVRSLGVQKGVALSGVSVIPCSKSGRVQNSLGGSLQVLPFVIPLTYFLLLPRASAVGGVRASSAAYTAVPTADPTEDDSEETDVETTERIEEGTEGGKPTIHIALSFADKVELVKPLLLRFMLPLCELFLSTDFLWWVVLSFDPFV